MFAELDLLLYFCIEEYKNQFITLNKNIMAIHVTDANFDEMVINSKLPVMVDLWAEWCGPCKMIGPIIEEIAKEFEGKALITKMDVDSNPETSAKYGIRNIPTVLYIKGGQIVDKQVGAVPKAKFIEKLNAIL